MPGDLLAEAAVEVHRGAVMVSPESAPEIVLLEAVLDDTPLNSVVIVGL